MNEQRKEKWGIRKTAAYGACSVLLGVVLLVFAQPAMMKKENDPAKVIVEETDTGTKDETKSEEKEKEETEKKEVTEKNTTSGTFTTNSSSNANGPTVTQVVDAQTGERHEVVVAPQPAQPPVFDGGNMFGDDNIMRAPEPVAEQPRVEEPKVEEPTKVVEQPKPTAPVETPTQPTPVQPTKPVEQPKPEQPLQPVEQPKPVTVVSSNKLAPSTEVIEDENMMVGDVEVVQEGKDGVEELLSDGTRRVVLEPTSQILKVGVREVRVEEKEVTVAREVETTEDEEMMVGEPIVTREGRDGLEKVKTTKVFIRGKEVSSEEEREVLVEAISKTQIVGVLEYKTRTETRPIAITETFEKDPSLLEGDTRVKEEGIEGEERVTFTDKLIRGQVVESIENSTEVTKEMKQRVVLTGSAIKTLEEEIETFPIPITTKEVESEDMLKSDAPVETFAGEEGIKEVKTIIEKWDGVEKNRTTEERVTKPMKERIVTVGVKEIQVETKEQAIAIPEVIEYDETRLTTTPDVIIEGAEGREEVTTTKTLIRGQVTDTQVEKREITAPTPKRIIKGSKIVNQNGKEITRTIKFIGQNGEKVHDDIIQKVTFAKTTWTNNDRVEWENDTKVFLDLQVPQITNRVTSESIPSQNVVVTDGNSELTINYTNEIRTETNSSLMDVVIVEDGTNLQLGSWRSQAVDTTTKTDMVTGRVIETTTAPRNDLAFMGYGGITHRFKNQVMQTNQNRLIVYMEKLNATNKQVIDYLMGLSEEERYNLATRPREDNDGYTLKPMIELTREDAAYLFAKLNLQKYREESLRILNEERVKVGVNPLELKEEYVQGVQERADEQAFVEGYLRSVDEDGDGKGDKAHFRPNGDNWTTAFEYADQFHRPVGENIGQNMDWDLERFISEKFLAEQHFDQFKNSPAHYSNMTSNFYTHASFAFQLSTEHKLIDEAKNGQSDIFVQVFGWHQN